MIIKNILFVFTAFTFSKIIGAFTSFIIPKLLDPSNYGAWVMLLLIMSYSTIVTFGAIEALMRQYPYFIGMGDVNSAHKIEKSVYGSIIISSVILLICGLICRFIITDPSISNFHAQIRVMFFAAAVSLCSSFFYYRFAAHQEFRYFGLIDALRALLMITIVCLCAWLWGLNGAVYGYLIIESIILLVVVLINNNCIGFLMPIFNIKYILDAIKIGFPITIVWWTINMETSVDRILSSTMIGQIQTGYYGLGISIVGTITMIPRAVNRVLYPKINEIIGSGLGVNYINEYVTKPVRIFGICLPLVIGVLVIGIPPVYKYLFPNYMPGLFSAQILCLGFFFMGIIGNGANYLVAINKLKYLLFIVVASIFINYISAYSLVKLVGMGIEGIAISASIAAFVLATSLWYKVLSLLGYDCKKIYKEIAILYLSFIVMLCLIFTYLNPEIEDCTIGISLIHIAFFTAIYTITILYVPPYKQMSREIFSMIFSKRKNDDKSALLQKTN